jgi:hypothetical protein
MKKHSNKLKHHYSRSNFGTAGGAAFSHNNPHFSKNDTQGILINKVVLPPKPKFFSDFAKQARAHVAAHDG